ncbi:cytochrome c oxidase subunit II [Phenylobacterium soli]|nr:cytochrome c oxidase subunit II [Phenylobacterium soli]
MSYLATAGASAAPITRLGWGLLTISIVVVLMVGALLAGALWRRRAGVSPDPEGRLPVERRGPGLRWVWVGVGISTLALFVSTVWTLTTLAAVRHPPRPPALTIQVTGHDWWWEARYLGDAPGRDFTTANELHIPVGQPVRLELRSADVIHSFWIPKLGGKTDLIPGRTNMAWIEADRPGDYRGQCGEFCGLEHARMALQVVADPPAAFQAWRDRQLAAPAPAASPPIAAGAAVFQARCGACHAIRGTPAGGLFGPDLSHLALRRTLAAGTLTNDPQGLTAWLADPQAIKPGNEMPRVPLTDGDRAALVAYLQSLS